MNFRDHIRAPSVLEPLETWFRLGVGIAMLGIAMQCVIAWQSHLWSFSQEPAPVECGLCEAQWKSKEDRQATLYSEIAISQQRMRGLKESLTNHYLPGFVEVRNALAVEESILASKQADLERLKVQPVSQTVWWLCLGVIFTLLIALMVARLVEFHARKATRSAVESLDSGASKKCYFWIAVLLAASSVSRDVMTSIVMIEKTWYGAASFCVSPPLWACWVIVGIGASLCIAYPISVLWACSGSIVIAKQLEPNHPDGQWGMGKVMFFVQLWASLCLFCVSVPSAGWIKLMQLSGRGSWQYFISICAVLVLCLLISIRFVWQATILRQRYQDHLAGLAQDWQKIQKLELPADPTIPFLGESWWKLPAVVLGFGTVFWAVIEVFGLVHYLNGILGI